MMEDLASLMSNIFSAGPGPLNISPQGTPFTPTPIGANLNTGAFAGMDPNKLGMALMQGGLKQMGPALTPQAPAAMPFAPRARPPMLPSTLGAMPGLTPNPLASLLASGMLGSGGMLPR